MSTNVFRTLKFISDIQLVPLEQANLLHEIFPDKDLSLRLGDDLDAYGFKMTDSVTDLYRKYFEYHRKPEAEF